MLGPAPLGKQAWRTDISGPRVPLSPQVLPLRVGGPTTPSGASALGQALTFTTKTSTAIQSRAGKPPAKVTCKVTQGHRARWSSQGRAQQSHIPRLTLRGPHHMGRGLQMDLRANSPPQPGQLRALARLFRPGAHKGQPSTGLQKYLLLHLGHPTQPEPRGSAVICTPQNRQNWRGQGEGSRGQGEGSHGQQKAQGGRGYFPARQGPKPTPAFRLHSQRRMGWGGRDDTLGRQVAAVLAGLSTALHSCSRRGCCGQLCAQSILPFTNSAPQRGPGFLPTSRGHRKGPAGVCVSTGAQPGQTALTGTSKAPRMEPNFLLHHLTPGCPLQQAFCSPALPRLCFGGPAPHCTATSSLGGPVLPISV